MEYIIYIDNKRIGEENNIIHAIDRAKTHTIKKLAEIIDFDSRKIVWRHTVDDHGIIQQ